MVIASTCKTPSAPFVPYGDWSCRLLNGRRGDWRRLTTKDGRVNGKDIDARPFFHRGSSPKTWTPEWKSVGTSGKGRKLHRPVIGNSDVLFEHSAQNIYNDKEDSLELRIPELSRPCLRKTFSPALIKLFIQMLVPLMYKFMKINECSLREISTCLAGDCARRGHVAIRCVAQLVRQERD